MAIKILFGLEAGGGGAMKHVCYLATQLDRNRFDITIMLSQRDPEAPEKIRQLRAGGVKVIIIPMVRKVNPVKDLVALYLIFRHIRGRGYNVVHAHSSKAGVLFRLAGWLCGVKMIVYTPHCFSFQGGGLLQRRMYALIERVMAMMTHKIVVSTGEWEFARHYQVAGADKFLFINNALLSTDYAHHDECAVRSELGIPAGKMVVGSVGRFTVQKDWDTWLKTARLVMERNDQVLFVIAGDGELSGWVKQEITALGLSDHVLLYGYREDLSKLYTIMDIFLTTSRWEGLPYVLLEAMYYGKPIVASKLGYTDVVTGHMVAAGDLDGFAAGICELLENAQLRLAMGEAGSRMLHEHCSFAAFINRHEQLYESVETDRKYLLFH